MSLLTIDRETFYSYQYQEFLARVCMEYIRTAVSARQCPSWPWAQFISLGYTYDVDARSLLQRQLLAVPFDLRQE